MKRHGVSIAPRNKFPGYDNPCPTNWTGDKTVQAWHPDSPIFPFRLLPVRYNRAKSSSSLFQWTSHFVAGKFIPHRTIALLFLFLLALTACQTEDPPPTLNVQAVTVSRMTPTPNHPTATPENLPISDLPTCDPSQVAELLAGMPAYEPSDGAFVQLDDNQLLLEDAPFVMRGVSYYPAEYPFWRFLQADSTTIETDLDTIVASGLNTIRIFIWNEPLFTCPGNGAVPLDQQFQRLDAIMQAAASRGLHLIVTLHEQPDVTAPPLYENPPPIPAQMAYIVQRYKDEPAILAWDVRDAGDTDYQGGTVGGVPHEAHFERAAVLDWLFRASGAIRAIDKNHLITAGWYTDNLATAAAVDFVSFQFWGEPGTLEDRITQLRQQTDKPLLLIGIGYESQTRNESQQSSALRESLQSAERGVEFAGLIGWVVWTAFDFVPGSACDVAACVENEEGQPDARHFYGIWRQDRSRKPAANVIEVMSRLTE